MILSPPHWGGDNKYNDSYKINGGSIMKISFKCSYQGKPNGFEDMSFNSQKELVKESNFNTNKNRILDNPNDYEAALKSTNFFEEVTAASVTSSITSSKKLVDFSAAS